MSEDSKATGVSADQLLAQMAESLANNRPVLPDPATRPAYGPYDNARCRIIGHRGPGAFPALMEDYTDLQTLNLVRQAYQYATSRHYSDPATWCMGRDPLRWKGHKAVLEAAALLREKGYPPHIWADWFVGWWKEKTARPKAPVLGMVFSPGQVEKRRGWFRRERAAELELSDPVYHPEDERVCMEQHLRNQEAQALWRGGLQPGQVGSYPDRFAWYKAKREAEVAQGHLDPMELYPRLPELKRGPVVRR